MTLLKLGDKSKAICGKCGAIRPTTFSERDVPLSSGRGVVRDVLVGVCDVCGTVVDLPAQSVPRVKEFLSFLAKDIEQRPEMLKPLSADSKARMASLVGDAKVDLDEPIEGDVDL